MNSPEKIDAGQGLDPLERIVVALERSAAAHEAAVGVLEEIADELAVLADVAWRSQ